MPQRVVWNETKNDQLYAKRGVTFEEVAAVILVGGEVDDYGNPNQQRYPGQRICVVEIRGYLYMVPYLIEQDGTRFLKTVFPSSRAMRRYGRRRIR